MSAVDVHLLQVPVPLWERAQQQTQELMREFALAAASDEDSHQLPGRLTRLIEALTSDFDGVSTAQEDQLWAAAAAGQPVIEDLAFAVPPAAGPACQALGDMLDEADEFCREGQHLLTLAADEDVARFRRWYLVEFVRQIAGERPCAWPDYDGWWPAQTDVTRVSAG